MIGQFLFTKLSIPSLSDGQGGYNVYPLSINEGIDMDTIGKAVIYNQISSSHVYTQSGVRVQLTCVADTYADSENLSYEVMKIFANKKYDSIGDVIYTDVEGRADIGKDRDSDKYLSIVDIYIKTAQILQD